MFHMKHLFFLKRIIPKRKPPGSVRSRRFYIGKKKKRGDYLVILLQALIQLDRKVGADTLEHLHDNDK